MRLARSLHKIRRFLCRVGIHRWTKWKDDGLYYIEYDLDENSGFCRFYYRQVFNRRCRVCNAKEIRKVDLK